MAEPEEKRVLVTSQDELRIGMKVVLTECSDCGGEHGQLLTGFDGNWSWKVSPVASCRPDDYVWLWVRVPIEERRLFRIDDGLTDEILSIERRAFSVMADALAPVAPDPVKRIILRHGR